MRQKLTQSDLGALAGIARENVSRILKEWTSRSLVNHLAIIAWRTRLPWNAKRPGRREQPAMWLHEAIRRIRLQEAWHLRRRQSQRGLAPAGEQGRRRCAHRRTAGGDGTMSLIVGSGSFFRDARNPCAAVCFSKASNCETPLSAALRPTQPNDGTLAGCGGRAATRSPRRQSPVRNRPVRNRTVCKSVR